MNFQETAWRRSPMKMYKSMKPLTMEPKTSWTYWWSQSGRPHARYSLYIFPFRSYSLWLASSINPNPQINYPVTPPMLFPQQRNCPPKSHDVRINRDSVVLWSLQPVLRCIRLWDREVRAWETAPAQWSTCKSWGIFHRNLIQPRTCSISMCSFTLIGIPCSGLKGFSHVVW